jgi:hypothetical protein
VLAVSCHVEQPLDGPTWRRLERLRRRERSHGLTIAALMRPPDERTGEDPATWVERARAAAQLGPLGHHTHWTSPSHARPSGGDPGERVRSEADWLRSQGLRPTLFCGGGWYLDEGVAEVVASAGYADCTARSSRPSYLEPGAAWAHAAAPVWWRLPSGKQLLELPTTHGLGAAARGAVRPLPSGGLVHVYFHDYDLLDVRRRAALEVTLRILRRRCSPIDLDELARRTAGTAEEAPLAVSG